MTLLGEAMAPRDDLLERFRAGDHDAFADVIEQHEAMVFSIALRFFADRQRAEEIAQDVFLQLFRSREAIESESHIVFWLRQVTGRRCIDESRRRARLRVVRLDEAEPVSAPQRLPDPLLARSLLESIAELPATQKLIVTLRYQEEIDPSDIAPLLGMPVKTVKSHLHRALVALRKKLGVSA